MNKLAVNAIAAFLLCVMPTHEANARAPRKPMDLKSIATLTGQCIRLKFGTTDASNACQSKVVNESFRSGRTGFTFVAGDLAVVSFSGMGVSQVKINSDKISQPIDHIIWTLVGAGTAPIGLSAVGSCTYTNPYKGPSSIACVARTSQGSFEANFLSDGRPPDISNF